MLLIQYFLLLFFSIFLYSYEKLSAQYVQPIDFQCLSQQPYQYDQAEQAGNFHVRVENSSSCAVITAQEYVHALKQTIINEIVCRQIFHMTIIQKEQMKQLNYDDFVKALLLRDDLSDQAILALWDEYKNKRIWNFSNEKDDNEIKVKDWLKKRRQKIEVEERRKEKEEREAQEWIIKRQNLQAAHEQHEREFIVQEYQYLTYIYNNLSFQSFGNEQASESNIIIRQQALEKTKSDSFLQYDQQYCLTPQTEAYARLQDFDVSDYRNFYGTALQQQFHREVCDIFEQVATLQKDLPYKSNLLLGAVLCADAADEMNRKENMQSVMSLTDLGFVLLDAAKQYGQAVCKGVLSSGTDFVHGLFRPDEIILSVGNALYFVIETAALNCYREEYGFEDLYIPLRDERNAQIIAGLNALGSAIVDSTGPQKVEALTRFGSDFFVPGKIMHVVGATLGVLRSQVKIARSVETVVAVAEDNIGLQEITCDIATTVQKMESIAQENIAQKTAQKLLSTEKQFDKSANPVSGRNVLKSVEDLLKETALGDKTKGRVKQYIKKGSYEDAIKDFDSLKPSNVQSILGKEGQKGVLPDGRKINVRLDSTDKRPTLEIQPADGNAGRTIKIRYGNKNTLEG